MDGSCFIDKDNQEEEKMKVSQKNYITMQLMMILLLILAIGNQYGMAIGMWLIFTIGTIPKEFEISKLWRK